MTRGLIVDLFAGGGGASTGIYLATGRHPDVAVNHSPAAIAMHTANLRHHDQDEAAILARYGFTEKP